MIDVGHVCTSYALHILSKGHVPGINSVHLTRVSSAKKLIKKRLI